jgi:hypothetical protein
MYRVILKRLFLNPLNAELNPIRHLLALAGVHHVVDVSRIRVKVKNKEIDSIKNRVFEKNIRAVFCGTVEEVNCLTDYSFDVLT